jgi:hypothetical protein
VVTFGPPEHPQDPTTAPVHMAIAGHRTGHSTQFPMSLDTQSVADWSCWYRLNDAARANADHPQMRSS